MASAKTIPLPQVQAAIARLAAAIAERHRGSDRLWLLGIANGGTPLAHRLADAINARMPSLPRRRRSRTLKGEASPKSGGESPARSAPPAWATAGALDISFHRDDIGHHPVPKEFANTFLPGDVTGATVILVDDVLFTGRTIKASLDELFDHGRPAQVELAVLVDRGCRRLPVAPDFVGLALAGRPKARPWSSPSTTPIRNGIASGS